MAISLKITARAGKRLGDIERLIGRWEGAVEQPEVSVKWQKEQAARIAFDTVALSGSGLSAQHAAEVLRGKSGLASAGEVLELENAQRAYERVGAWDALRKAHLLEAHGVLLEGLSGEAGQLRARRFDAPLKSLLQGVEKETDVPSIVSAVLFHHELLRLRPFSDGNGRIGRLWQRALLRRASSLFEHAPVESVLREPAHVGLLREASDPFLENMLEVLLLSLERLQGVLRGREATATDRYAKARGVLGKRWFSRKEYRAIFPTLSTATASRDIAHARAAETLTARGDNAQTEYRFR